MTSAVEGDLAFHPGAGDQVVHPVEAAEQRALAAAGRADQGRDPVPGDVDRDVPERQRCAVPDREIPGRQDHGGGRRGGRAAARGSGRGGSGATLVSGMAHGTGLKPRPWIGPYGSGSRSPSRSSSAAGGQKEQDPAGGDRLEGDGRAPWRSCRSPPAAPCSGSTAPGESSRSPRRRPPSTAARSRRSPATGPRIVPVRMPGRAEGRTWSRVTCHLVAPERHRRLAERGRHRPERLLGRDHDHRQDQEAQRQSPPPRGPCRGRDSGSRTPGRRPRGRGCRRRSTARPPGWRCSSG